MRAVSVFGVAVGGDDVNTHRRNHDRRLVLIAGSGRSGTSLMSLALKQLGAHVPQPEVPANDTNPAGFGEPQWLVDFHNEQLRKLDIMLTEARPAAIQRSVIAQSSTGAFNSALPWFIEQSDASGVVVLKDPRLTWFLDLWAEVGLLAGVAPSVIRMVRDPRSVVGSKLRWYANNRTPDFLLGGWIIANQAVDICAERVAVRSVEHHALIRNPVVEVERIVERLDLGCHLEMTPESVSAISGLLDRERIHSESTAHSFDEVCNPDVLGLAMQIHRSLCEEISGGTDADQALEDRRDLYARYASVYAAAERLSHHSQQIEINRQQRLLRERDVKLKALSEERATAQQHADRVQRDLDESRQRTADLQQRLRQIEQARLGFRARRLISARRQRLLAGFRRVSPGLYEGARRGFRSVRPKRR